MSKRILDEHGEPKLAASTMEWALAFERSENRQVKRESIGDAEVSTVFMGLDYDWETMVFGGVLDQCQDRCDGPRRDAMAMHERMVSRVKKSQTGEVSA